MEEIDHDAMLMVTMIYILTMPDLTALGVAATLGVGKLLAIP